MDKRYFRYKYFEFYLCSLSESYSLFIYFIYLFYFLEECIAFELKFAFYLFIVYHIWNILPISKMYFLSFNGTVFGWGQIRWKK